MDINSFARTLHAAPDPTLKWISYADGQPVALKKTTANPRTRPICYLAQAEQSLAGHSDSGAIKSFVASELSALGVESRVPVRDLGAMAAVYAAVAKECDALALKPALRQDSTSLADLGRAYAALSERSARCLDVPFFNDPITDGFLRGGSTPETFERLMNTVGSLYDYVQRGWHPAVASYGKALAKSTRDADPKLTNAFFDLLDRVR